MGEVLKDDTLGATIANLNRRLQIMESTQRVGLNRIRFAWSTHAAGAAPVSAMAAWATGTASATWADDRGNTGTGYPQLAVEVGKKAIFLTQTSILNVSTDAGFKSSQLEWGVGLDAANPTAWPAAFPVMRGGASKGPVTEGTTRLTWFGGRADLDPGVHTFKFWDYWYLGAGGATLPSIHSLFLAVVPID